VRGLEETQRAIVHEQAATIAGRVTPHTTEETARSCAIR